jgi:hypothetical protein
MSVAASRAITVETLTPMWLSGVLQREGILPSGRVIAIEREPTSSFNSHTLHLQPIYDEVLNSAPKRLLLKCSLPQPWAQRAGARETAFYQMVSDLPDHPSLIPHCYDAVYDADSGNSHLLLDDLSASHVVPVPRQKQIALTGNLPTDTHLTQAVEALARFHAYWWQHPQLGTGAALLGAWCSDEEHFAAETARRRRAWDDLIALEHAWFPPELAAIYGQILDRLMDLWQRYLHPRLATLQHMTLTHGDAYLANFLCPREGQTGNAYLVDWQSPEVYLGASDLVTLCATFWTREQRADGERELNVLRHYHRTLQENGVHGYAWEDLVNDYRYALVDWLLVPLQDRLEGSAKSYWWPKMQCLAHAYEDWHVAELFAETHRPE